LSDKKVCFDNFVLDFGRFQLCCGDRLVNLEGLPLRLLMFLTGQQGQLVTREQIAAELWGNDVFVDVEQGINTAVRKIRRALNDDPGQPRYLQTVVGRGYRFVARMDVQEDGAPAKVGNETLRVSPEELGRAIMTAAGLDPENLKGPLPGDS
jgi:DNA-binding winged helix-turn-helix (wHTH) protein